MPKNKETAKMKKFKQCRNHRVTVLLNDEENIFIENYCKSKNINNKARLFREITIRTLLDNIHNNAPTLFD